MRKLAMTLATSASSSRKVSKKQVEYFYKFRGKKKFEEVRRRSIKA